jgi:hypothetical protein
MPSLYLFKLKFDLYFTKNRKVPGDQMNDMGGACGTCGRPDGKSPLGRPRRRWEDNIKMALQEVG